MAVDSTISLSRETRLLMQSQEPPPVSTDRALVLLMEMQTPETFSYPSGKSQKESWETVCNFKDVCLVTRNSVEVLYRSIYTGSRDADFAEGDLINSRLSLGSLV